MLRRSGSCGSIPCSARVEARARDCAASVLQQQQQRHRHVLLHQRYLGCIVVRSQLHVRLHHARVMRSFEERWNGKPLLGAAFPLRTMPAVRRINALLSFLATTNLLA